MTNTQADGTPAHTAACSCPTFDGQQARSFFCQVPEHATEVFQRMDATIAAQEAALNRALESSSISETGRLNAEAELTEQRETIRRWVVIDERHQQERDKAEAELTTLRELLGEAAIFIKQHRPTCGLAGNIDAALAQARSVLEGGGDR